MKFFVDANVPIYASTGEAPYGAVCADLIGAVARGAGGTTSVAVLEEVWHLELKGRIGAVPGLAERTLATLAPLLPVTEEILRQALRLDTPGLGANDRIHVATCRLHGIETIVSADAAFDKVPGLRRVDPLDNTALGALFEGP